MLESQYPTGSPGSERIDITESTDLRIPTTPKLSRSPRLARSPQMTSPLPSSPLPSTPLPKTPSTDDLCFVDSRLSSPTTPKMRTPSAFCNDFDAGEENIPPKGLRSPRRALFPSSSPRKNLALTLAQESIFKPELPTDIQVIVDSRPASIRHDLHGFEAKTYKEFWMISTEETQVYRDWNTLEFEKQSRLFELFNNLLRIRFNMRRVIDHYGPAFKHTPGLTANQDADYNKTFVPLESLYHYLDRFVIRKMLPLYEHQMFVDDHAVAKVSSKWFRQVASQYTYISRSVVYLARLAANDTVRNWIADVELQDTAANDNRFAPSARELFSSYFIKLFTPMTLIFRDLQKVYVKTDQLDLLESMKQIAATLDQINSTSDYTTDLDNKIALNQNVVCADYLYLEMVDLFSPERHLRPAFEMESKHGIQWGRCQLVLCDNYLLPLAERKTGDAQLYLAKPPIALQYISYHSDQIDDQTYSLVVRDCGNEITYTFRTLKDQQMPKIQLDNFVKDLNSAREALLDSMSAYNATPISGSCFMAPIEKKPVEDPYKPDGPFAVRPLRIDTSITTAEPLCASSFVQRLQRFWIVGATDGIYVGKQGDENSWYNVCRLTRVSRIHVLEEGIILCQSGDKLLQGTINDVFSAYKAGARCDSQFKEVQKHIQGYELALQKFRKGPIMLTSRFIFCWKDKKIKYSPFTAEDGWNTEFKSIKAAANVKAIYGLEPTHFIVCHDTDEGPIFYLSNLSSLTNTQLPNEDDEMHIRKKMQHPVGAFRLSQANSYEIMLVYTRYCILVSYDSTTRSFKRSRDSILRFNCDCTEASFNELDGTLFACGERGLEAWHIPSRNEETRPQCVASFLGQDAHFLGQDPRALVMSFKAGSDLEPRHQLFQVRKAI